MFFAFAVLYCASIALPGLLQSLFGYDALRSGLAMSPSGVSSMAAMVVAGVLLGRRVDARWLIAAGLVVMAAGNYWMARMNLQIGPWQVIWPRMLLTLGLGLLFAPISVAAYKYIPLHLRGAAVGLLSLLRTEGGSVGTSLSQTIQEPREQFHLSRLGESLGPLNPHVQSFLGQTRESLPAVDRRPGPVAAVGRPGARRPAPAAGRLAGLLRRLLAVRRPVGSTRRSGPADEALGGREGRAYRCGVASNADGGGHPTVNFRRSFHNQPTILRRDPRSAVE